MSEKRRFLAEYGEQIVANGYSLIPIKPGQKAPYGDDWQKLRVDRSGLRRLIDKYPDAGVGILTYNAPFVDLDIPDGDVCDQMEEWIALNICELDDYVRVGNAPRRGIPFRADDSFKKMISSTFIVPDLERALPPGYSNDQHKKVRARIEVLGDGQQYVSRHIHPDTGRPYTYPRGGAPETVARDDLPLLTQKTAQRIIDEFHRLMAKLGWKPHRTRENAALAAAGEVGGTSHIPTSNLPVDMDEETIELTLMTIPPREDYEGWLEIGAALHHQYRGGQRGLELWDKHSMGAMAYDPVEIERKWDSFGKDASRRNVTFRTLIDAAKAHETKRILEAVEDVRLQLTQATTIDSLKKVVKLIKTLDLDPLAMNTVINEFRIASRRISGVALSLPDAKRMLRRQDLTTTIAPAWAENWYFLSDDGDFYHAEKRQRMKRDSFNALYDRELISKMERLEGKGIPDIRAAELALNVYQIPVAANMMFWPGQSETFQFEDKPYVNGFSENSLPTMPDRLTSDDRLAVKRFLCHLEHLIADQRDRETVLAWYAYIARTLSRPNFAVVLQGAEGDGKSTLLDLMGAMLGSSNVATINATTLESPFTDWAHGHVFACIEEVKLQGKNRYEVLNRIKPMITNNIIEVHPKGKRVFQSLNTQAYLLLTNFPDAMPLTDGDSRYFVTMSRWQSHEKLEEFKAENPDYYPDLQDMLERGPAIRKWMLTEYKLPDWFNPKARAPRSASKSYMIEVSKGDVEDQIVGMLQDSDSVHVSESLLDATLLRKMIMDGGYVAPSVGEIKRALIQLQYQFLGQWWVDGARRKYWSRHPERFVTHDVVDHNKIRQWVADDL